MIERVRVLYMEGDDGMNESEEGGKGINYFLRLNNG
jgi:hypothetical protein